MKGIEVEIHNSVRTGFAILVLCNAQAIGAIHITIKDASELFQGGLATLG